MSLKFDMTAADEAAGRRAAEALAEKYEMYVTTVGASRGQKTRPRLVTVHVNDYKGPGRDSVNRRVSGKTEQGTVERLDVWQLKRYIEESFRTVRTGHGKGERDSLPSDAFIRDIRATLLKTLPERNDFTTKGTGMYRTLYAPYP